MVLLAGGAGFIGSCARGFTFYQLCSASVPEVLVCEGSASGAGGEEGRPEEEGEAGKKKIKILTEGSTAHINTYVYELRLTYAVYGEYLDRRLVLTRVGLCCNSKQSAVRRR